MSVNPEHLDLNDDLKVNSPGIRQFIINESVVLLGLGRQLGAAIVFMGLSREMNYEIKSDTACEKCTTNITFTRIYGEIRVIKVWKCKTKRIIH